MTRHTAKKVVTFYQHHEVSTSRRYRASSGRTIQQDIRYVPTSTPLANEPPSNDGVEVECAFPDDFAPEVIEHQISGYTVVAKPRGDDPRKRYECTVNITHLSSRTCQTLIPRFRWHPCSGSKELDKNTWTRSFDWKAAVGLVGYHVRVVAIPPPNFDVAIAWEARSSVVIVWSNNINGFHSIL